MVRSLRSCWISGHFGFLALAMIVAGCQLVGGPTQHAKDIAVDSNSKMLLYQPSAENSPESVNKPYLILISIDGYRYDYNKKFAPVNLSRLAEEGVQAESLQPVYPSKTFPNHYSLVTGMYVDHHGIVSNEFYDPARDATYSLPDRKAVEDGSWYFGEPIWITAGRQGMLSASFFWVGSEADIQSAHPNYFYRYDDSVPFEKRVDRVLEWLKLPPERRPHLLTLYFENVDATAHRFGTDSQQLRDAVGVVDAQIGRLRQGLKALDLPVNIVLVSDHGMQDVDPAKLIILDDGVEKARILAKFQAVGRGPQMLLYLNKGEKIEVIDEAERILASGARNYRVLRRDRMARYHFSSTPRVGDLVIEPDAPYLVGLRARLPSVSGANHGWDPVKNKTMHGVFYAWGPAFKEKARVATFENIHVYPLILSVLGLKQSVPIDGQLHAVRGVLR